ncbi:MFS transporter [Aquirufa sp. KTFRIE-69F]|jgi:MFS family permease|uniref:MFS transporter n=1 Tax=Aquirufa originis TaxID=3096514 RepID=A0ABW6DAX6_9BACT|nr:MFS transporter [Aquirufa antheringensis]MCE4216207.1 MFS transporter [Pseudarcicella sp. GAP-15]USQ04207.1 MHS family MFS transporter [Aquirufa antheringensis]
MTTKKQSLAYIISASSVGTLIEWYDFYIFGSLATVLSTKFFPTDNPTAAFLNTLATFAAGFVVRPFGALVFGRLGDLIGRKYTFMVTLMLMGGATFAIGLIPSYATIGAWAPILVLTLRLLQGLALGGEYGGAATYVAEHAPAERRGFFTSWIQTTATLGLVISLAVIMATRSSMSKEAFDDFGWRIPFLVSILMVLVSLLIRKNMEESPMFAKAKAEGNISKNPLKESFGNKLNLKYVLLALFGATMGQGLVWYTGQFYAQTFLLKICNLDDIQTNTILVIGLLLGTPLFVIFGALSDKIGRKGIMMAGMIIAVLSYRPIFDQMYKTVDVTNKTVVPGSEKMTLKGKTTTITKEYTDGSSYKNVITEVSPDKTESKISIKINEKDQWTLVGYVFFLISFVTMAYGPIAAFLVEMFPTKIRYTSMSLPYHIGNGVFGGLMPAIATFLVSNAQTAGVVQKPYLEGLNYPIALISVCVVIGIIYIKSAKKAA